VILGRRPIKLSVDANSKTLSFRMK